eukprot:14667049-Alexandrium_andersonii.AAC.1
MQSPSPGAEASLHLLAVVTRPRPKAPPCCSRRRFVACGAWTQGSVVRGADGVVCGRATRCRCPVFDKACRAQSSARGTARDASASEASPAQGLAPPPVGLPAPGWRHGHVQRARKSR